MARRVTSPASIIDRHLVFVDAVDYEKSPIDLLDQGGDRHSLALVGAGAKDAADAADAHRLDRLVDHAQTTALEHVVVLAAQAARSIFAGCAPPWA
jgi:hypothetical protein